MEQTMKKLLFSTIFCIVISNSALATMYTPREAATIIAQKITDNEYDTVYSSYFGKELTVSANYGYKDCMFETASFIAASQYHQIADADIPKIKSKAFDSVCVLTTVVDVQNKDWYTLMYEHCMNGDRIPYRHFAIEKYKSGQEISQEITKLEEARLKDEINGLSKTELDTKYSSARKELWQKAYQFEQDFFIRNLDEYEQNNKSVWCDCLALHFIAGDYIGSNYTIEKMEQYSNSNDIFFDTSSSLKTDFIAWNIRTNACYQENINYAETILNPFQMFPQQIDTTESQSEKKALLNALIISEKLRSFVADSYETPITTKFQNNISQNPTP